MYIHGGFLNRHGETVTVYIVTKGSREQELEIGTDEADVFFSEDPVEISDQTNDTFDVLLGQSVSIRLLCGNVIADLFSTSCRDAVVNVYKGGHCVFAGYVEPLTFSQPYNERWDELELNCISALSALQYSKYKNVGASGVSYTEVKASATQRSFLDIMKEVLEGVTVSLDIVNGTSVGLWYDRSKALTSDGTPRYDIFGYLTISELLFLGDEEDDVWQQNEVLEEMLKYLNLHIVQDGLDFYVFSWETVKNPAASIAPTYKEGDAEYRKTKWHDLLGGGSRETRWDTVGISLDNVADTGTTISIGDVYNQLLLTCSIENMDDLVESPLDEDTLTSPYPCRQKYMTEFSCYNESIGSYLAFIGMATGQDITNERATITDWYIQVMKHPQWTFPMKGDVNVDIVDYFSASGLYEHALPYWLGENPGACILSVGSVVTELAKKDNSPVSKIDMTDYLVVSVNGNSKDKEAEAYPTADSLLANMPYAVYQGSTAGGAFSPVNEGTTNYIVISGSLILNPIMDVSYDYTPLRNVLAGNTEAQSKLKLVFSREGEKVRYYTREFWKAEKPIDTETWYEGYDKGWYPYTDTGEQQYEFKYSAIGDGTDTVSKVAVLACMMIIGDKCLVETGTEGKPSDFKWRPYKEKDQCADEDEYYQQSFTIGFDPKIGDKLIGTEFDIQNNIDYKMNLDTEGMAIPIKMSDKLSGSVRFIILGPVNTLWDKVTRRHKTWFRPVKWKETSIPLLAHVSSILIKDFEIKTYSDNGLQSADGDNDVVYMSDTDEAFVNKKDDIEFKINSALTADECRTLGVANSVNMSTPWDTVAGTGATEVYDVNRAVKAKPEQIYVDRYYNEYHEPRIQMTQNFEDRDSTVSIFNHYRHDALGKEFFVQGIGRNLIEGTAKLTLKEIDND